MEYCPRVPASPTSQAPAVDSFAGPLALGLIGNVVIRNVVYDAAASIAIGVLMSSSALVLAQRNRLLLLGEAARPEIETRIRRIVLSDPALARLLSLRTRVLAADEYRVDLQVDLDSDSVVDRLKPEIRAAAAGIHGPEDLEAFARRFARRVVDEMAGEVDRLERRIREEVPGARVIDVEAD